MAEQKPDEEYQPTMELRWKDDGFRRVLQRKYVHPETGDEEWRAIPIE